MQIKKVLAYSLISGASLLINLSAHADCPKPVDIEMTCNNKSNFCTFTSKDKHWQFIETFDSYIDKEKCADANCPSEKKDWIQKFKNDKKNLEFIAVQYTPTEIGGSSTLKNKSDDSYTGTINFCKYGGLESIDAIPLTPTKIHLATLTGEKSHWKSDSKGIYTCLENENACEFVFLKI